MKKSVILFLHLSFWILFSLQLCAILGIMLPRLDPEALIKMRFLITKITTIGVIIFYISYFVTPFFIRNKRRLYALLGSILILAILFSIKSKFINNNSSYLLNTIGVFTPPLIIAFIAFVLRTVIERWKDRIKNMNLEKEKLHTQLKLLKTKLNPHFLFNSLNNIDVLIEENPKTASEYLTKLSDILRYVLYEAKEESTLFSSELEQIKSYIELEKIRTDNAHFVVFNIQGELKEQKIAPMVFIPFIENAFKHSKNKSVDNAIQIGFDVHPDYIKMSCKNYYDPIRSVTEKNNGLGIEVMKQRLNLLYPEAHELIIDQSGEWFTVTLTIKFENGN